eukprot:5949897-Pleurochrysis_carterae.AAC.4
MSTCVLNSALPLARCAAGAAYTLESRPDRDNLAFLSAPRAAALSRRPKSAPPPISLPTLSSPDSQGLCR